MTVTVVAGLCGLVAPQAATADQLSSLRSEAEGVYNQIQTLGTQEATLSEQYDGANYALGKARLAVAEAAQALVKADAGTRKAKHTLQDEALNAYIHDGASGASGQSSSLGGADQSLLRAEYVSSLTSSQTDAADQYHLAALQAATAKASLQTAEAAAAHKVTALAAARAQVVATHDQLEGVLSKDQGQIATLVAQIEAQKEAAAQAAATAAANARAAQARAQAIALAASTPAATTPAATTPAVITAPATSGTTQPSLLTPGSTAGTTAPTLAPVPTDPPAVTVPSENGGAGGAIAAAETRLGDPYVWGAAGPSSFDCSGLVQWAYAQVGISLPHYSGAQYADGVKIPMSGLEPGDLVFFANPGDHVAIYIGGGQIIEAPHTGDVVHIVAMYSSFVLAVRIA